MENNLFKTKDFLQRSKRQLCGDDETQVNFDGRTFDMAISNHGRWPPSVLTHGPLKVTKLHVSGAVWSTSGNAIVSWEW